MNSVKLKYEASVKKRELSAATVLASLPTSSPVAKTKPAPPKTKGVEKPEEKKARGVVSRKTAKPDSQASQEPGDQCIYVNSHKIQCENEIALSKGVRSSKFCLPHKIKADKGSSREYRDAKYEEARNWYKTFEKTDRKLGKCYGKEGKPVKESAPAPVSGVDQGGKTRKPTPAPVSGGEPVGKKRKIQKEEEEQKKTKKRLDPN